MRSSVRFKSRLGPTVLLALAMLAPALTDGAAWGANLPGSPVAADSTSYERTTIFFVIVPNWSDGTPGPTHK